MFASLGSNDEEIRKCILESPGLMSDLMTAVEGDCESLQLAALRCLLSLSRSVQTLRTAMQVRHTAKRAQFGVEWVVCGYFFVFVVCGVLISHGSVVYGRYRCGVWGA